MRIVRQRQQAPRYIGNPNSFDGERIASMHHATCASCGALWAFAMLRDKDGMLYCPNDFDELNAREALEQIARDMEDGARSPVRPLVYQRPVAASSESPVGVVTSITNASGAAVNERAPLSLARGGSAVTLKLNGVGFSSADTISCSSGISNSTSPVITTTLITLSVVASGGMAAGDNYSLTFNGTTFRNIFRVR